MQFNSELIRYLRTNEQLATMLPYARLVVLLREPAERFRSNLKMELCRVSTGSVRPIDIETHLLNEGFFIKGQFDEYLHSHRTTLGHVQHWCSIFDCESNYARLWRCLALRSTMMPLVTAMTAMGRPALIIHGYTDAVITRLDALQQLNCNSGCSTGFERPAWLAAFMDCMYDMLIMEEQTMQ